MDVKDQSAPGEVMHLFVQLLKLCLSFSRSAPGPSTSGECSKTLKAPAGLVAGSKRSIQGMKDKSDTYKSIFSSHSSAKRTKDQLSNWVTHTPYHFWVPSS